MLQNGADPNATNMGGESGLYWAATRGHDDVALVLLVFGAKPNLVTRYGDTAVAVAVRRHRAAVASLFAATEEWSPLKIAVAAGLQADAEAALQLGLIGTAADSRASLSRASLCPSGPGNTSVATFVRRAMAPWSPTNHWLHHAQVRSAVWTVLLVAVKPGNCTPGADDSVTLLPTMPPLVWRLVCSFFLRQDWPPPELACTPPSV